MVRFDMRTLLIIAALALIVGCATAVSKEHQVILDWNTEGHHTYRVKDGVDYFVKCEGGLKYVGYNIPATGTQDGMYQVIGPVDVCEEKDSEAR